MADSAEASEPVEQYLTFNIKASNDQKFVLTLPITTTIADVKNKLAGSDYADIPAERIRLIYSGRVLKNEDTLSTYNVKDGNTIHMVKGAMSNARQNPQASSTSSAATPAVPALPNMATGTGNNPLAGLTGARYAGFHGLPSANMFGADGGMGAPPPPDEMLRMLDDPNFAQTMNEALNNPDMLRILEQHPMMRDNPQLRNMIRNPEMRRLMFNPEMLRMQLQMQRAMGGDGGGGDAFPAPGVTDTTPGAAGAAPGGNTQPAANPLASLFGPGGGLGGAGGAGGAANPLAALFANRNLGTTPATSPPAAASAGQGTPSTNTTAGQQDPFANLFGAAQAGAGGAAGGNDPLANMMGTVMRDPDMMRNVMQMMGGAGGPGAAPGVGGGAAANPFAALFGPGGGMGGFGAPQEQTPPDTRPPEERYESQLRQLNDMGFFEFERNIEALRRSGGSVQGAIEHLLGGS